MAAGGFGSPNKYTTKDCWGADAPEREPRVVDTFSVVELEKHKVQIQCWIKPEALQLVTEFLCRFGCVNIRRLDCHEVARVRPQAVVMRGGKATLVSSVFQADERYQPGNPGCSPFIFSFKPAN